MVAQKSNGAAAQAGVAKTGRTVKQDYAEVLAPLDHEARQCLQRACKQGVMTLGELDPTVLQDLGRKAAANQLSVVRKLVTFAPNVQKPNKTGLLINIMKRRYRNLPQLPQSGSGDSGLSTAEGDSSTEDGGNSDGVKEGFSAGDGRAEQSAASKHLLSLLNPAAASMKKPEKSSARILELIKGSLDKELSADRKTEIRREARAARAAEEKRDPPVSVKDMITGDPGALRVTARGRLQSPEVAFALIRELRVTLLRHRADNKPVGVADLDLSQNPLLMEHFRQIFHLLGKLGARVERFKFYGCSTFDDEVMEVLANYVAGLNADNVPLELHLSDCVIGTAGFKLLMHAIDQSPHFPAQSKGKSGKLMPLYLRVENNYIDEESIEDCKAAGLLAPLHKTKGRRNAEPPSEKTKVHLMVTGGGGFQQLDGPAPAVGRRGGRLEAKQTKERAEAGHVDDITAASGNSEWQQAMEIIESCRAMADPDTVVQWVRHLETAKDPVAEANRILIMSFRLMGQGFCQPSVASSGEEPHGTFWDNEHGLLLGSQAASPELSYGADPYGHFGNDPLAYDETAYAEEPAASPARPGRRVGRHGAATEAAESVESHLLGLLRQMTGGDESRDADEVGGAMEGGSAPANLGVNVKAGKKGRNKIGA